MSRIHRAAQRPPAPPVPLTWTKLPARQKVQVLCLLQRMLTDRLAGPATAGGRHERR